MPKGIYSRPSLAELLWPRVAKTEACWLWTGLTDKDGYGKIKHRQISTRTHRVAWELTYGPIPNGLWVLHHCDNPPCCRPDHLYLGTVLRNTQDAAARGLLRRGTTSHLAKLTDDQVREIRDRHTGDGTTAYRLAKEYGVTQRTVFNILYRVTWKHL